MSHLRGRRFVCVCEHCDEIFTRRTIDVRRSPRQFCGRVCHAASMRRGRATLEVACSGCGVVFPKARWHAVHDARHYCSRDCYQRHIDRSRLGRLGALANRRSVPAAVRFFRSQKAGLARAAKLSPERLSEIGRLGAAARIAKGATRGPGKRRRARRNPWVGPVLLRLSGS